MSRNILSPSYQGRLPADFLHGFASAAYQVEGGYQDGGRGLTLWDVKLKDQDNGNIACDSYHRYQDDVELLKRYGAKGYRFSIAWSRIIPLGGKDDPVNAEGIEYYSKLIDALIENGIQPVVTLFHWDAPVALNERYGGFLASKENEHRLLEDFANYASICFKAFGDRVKHWITINEPMIYAYNVGDFLQKEVFDFDTDRWRISRTIILAHAHAVKVYRQDYQTQGGSIGVTLSIEWCAPYSSTSEDIRAASRSLDVQAGLVSQMVTSVETEFADPIYRGKMNPTILEIAGYKFDAFTEDEWAIVRGSSDFFGLNHYSTRWLTTNPIKDDHSGIKKWFGETDPVTEREDGTPIGHRGNGGHPYIVPWGFGELLQYVWDTWSKPEANYVGKVLPIFITENGFAMESESSMTKEESINDTYRQTYFDQYLIQLVDAKAKGIDIMGYMAWSLLEWVETNLEWQQGYVPRFGVTYVDSETQDRTPKESALLLRDIFKHLIVKN